MLQAHNTQCQSVNTVGKNVVLNVMC